MPSAFAELWSASQHLIDAQWGEPVQLVPPNPVDTSRYVVRTSTTPSATRDVTGVFRDTSIIDTVKGSGANTHENVDVLTRRTSVDFDQTLFDDTNPIPAEGWIIVATSQPKMPRYKLVTAEPDGIARIFCKIAFLDYAPS